MSLFDFLKPPSKPALSVTIKSPRSFETTALKLTVSLSLASKAPQKVVKLALRLRADATKKQQSTHSKAYYYLGETIDSKELLVDPKQPVQREFELPLDFGPIDSFEIPPENLAVASEELKAAATANRTENYRYSIEVDYKLDSGTEQVVAQPIKLIQPYQVRVG